MASPTIASPTSPVNGSVQKVELDWQDVMTGNFPESPARQAWRTAVTTVAEKAKAALPACTGRVDKAVALVLAGDVALLPDGTAKVASQRNGTTTDVVVNGTCECPDYPKAPQGMCKHRIAYGIYKRATTLAQQTLAAQQPGTASQTHQDARQSTPPQPDEVQATLPEAPASCNVYVEISGRTVQVTLRDSDETRLLSRLETLLQRFPNVEGYSEQAPPEGWCSTHRRQMTRHRTATGAWWSHNTAQGWCRGR